MTNTAPQEPRYVDLDEASAITRVSKRTLRRAIEDRRLRAHRVGRLVRIALAEVHRWMESDGAAAPSKTKRK